MEQSAESIKNKAVHGIVWKFTERILAQVVSLIVSIILARMLTPGEYSVVGIVVIFFNFANVIISGGLNSALMQKKEADVEDYSTVLHISVLASVVLYGTLFFSAPLIADLYSLPILISVIRIMGLSLPIYAVKSVLCAYVSSNLQFRKFFFSTIGGTLLSAVVGIYMAYKGFGPWALVAQQLTNTVADTCILFLTTRMRIVMRISLAKFRTLFAYGWKVLVTSLLTTTYTEVIPLFIGIRFTKEDLSFYTKGKGFPELASSTVTNTLSAVMFPVMAKFQDDKERLLQYTRRFMRVASYISFPVMLGFLAVSDTFISVLLTEKWLPAAFYIRIFCVSSMFDMIHAGNASTIKAMGRSDIFLIMEVIKKSCYFTIIACFMFLSNRPQVLAIATIACTVVAIVVNCVPNRRLIGYSFRAQAMDLLPNLILAAIMCSVVCLVGMLSLPLPLLLLLQIGVGAVVYILLSILTRNDNFFYVWKMIGSYFKRR